MVDAFLVTDHDPMDQEALTIWNNGTISVISRRGNSRPIRLRIPYAADNGYWLHGGRGKRRPVWNWQDKYWELPSSRFNEVSKMILERFGSLYIIQPYRETEVCASACRKAKGFECQCSCMGAHHGSQSNEDWFEISETFAIRHGAERFACRLIVKTQTPILL